jgi:hypothetical protein
MQAAPPVTTPVFDSDDALHSFVPQLLHLHAASSLWREVSVS